MLIIYFFDVESSHNATPFSILHGFFLLTRIASI